MGAVPMPNVPPMPDVDRPGLHPNLAFFPNYKYDDEMIEVHQKYYDSHAVVKQFRIEGDQQRDQEGHLVQYDNASEWLKFRNPEEMERHRNRVLRYFHCNIDDWYYDEESAENICRMLAFSMASENVDRKIRHYSDNKPIFIRGTHKYRLFEPDSNEKKLNDVLLKVPEPFASAMMQTWRLMKLHNLSWKFQAGVGNEMGALMFRYAEDLYKESPYFNPEATNLLKCCKCESGDAAVVIY